MINIICNTEKYEYDIRALVMGFYPGEELSYHVGEPCRSDELHCEGRTDGTGEAAQRAEADTYILIKLGDMCMDIAAGADAMVKKSGTAAESMGSKMYRDVLKRQLYRCIAEYEGRELAWGTLTGVRPTKLPMKLLMQGYSVPEATEYMKREYYCTENKASLCTGVADTELRILNDIHFNEGYSVYIGIPFCPTVCSYCSFSSTAVNNVPGADRLMEEYIDALEKECAAVRDIYPDKRLTSIYVGGGTPTALNEKLLARLMDIIRDNFPVAAVYEYTVEAGRPDSINKEKLKIMKAGGVTRISVNPQTMKQETLHSIGRKHTVEQIIDIFYKARAAGFDNINMDLIAGLQGETVEDFKKTLEYIDKLGPDSFTVHSLVVKRASAYRQQRELLKAEASGGSDGGACYDNSPGAHGDSGNIVDMMLDMAAEYAYNSGYSPYYMYRQKNKAGLGENPVLENVGYARSGKEGIYNILIMEEKQTIIALGAGASSKLVYNSDENDYRIERIANVKNVREYIDRIDEMIGRKKRC